MKKIAIQGQIASFHHVAARQLFGENCTVLTCETFADVFDAVQNGEAAVGICAVENSLYGTITDTYDLLQQHNLWIGGEVYLPITQCLIGFPDASLADIREVYSHPVALAQCDRYLETMLPSARRNEHHDTAGSVADVAKWKDHTKAAIASREAADQYGLRVLVPGIETNKQNYTRFIAFFPKKQPATTANKTTLTFTLPNKPGALHTFLGLFANQNINVTSTLSRPIAGSPWEYQFYMDFAAGKDELRMINALASAYKDYAIRILGSYTAGQLPQK